jgi:hypothetical protein
MTPEEYDMIIQRNPELVPMDDLGEHPPTEAMQEINRQKREQLTREFETVWRQLGGPELMKEYRFHPRRKWRIDYYHPESQIGIEIEGGVWSQGRHVRGQGYIADCRKYNAATAAGVALYRIATGMVVADDLMPIITACRAAEDAEQARLDAVLLSANWPPDGVVKDLN